jgi:uncharacterized protein (DUF58 family)
VRAAPTARGCAVAGAAIVLGVASWALGYPELAVLSTACIAALLAGAAWLPFTVPLKVSRQVAPAKVPRGETAVGTVRVTNTGRRATRPLLAVDRGGTARMRVPVPGLAPGTSRFVSYRLPTERRGELSVGPLLLRAADPLGLFTRVLIYGAPVTLLVRPRTVPIPPLPSGRTASVEGPTSDTAPSGTIAFHTLREYVVGDDLRHVHWRTTARTNTLMVKHLVDTSLPETIVVLDTDSGAYPGEDDAPERDFDVAVDAAATVAVAMAGCGFPVTLLTTGGERFESRGVRTVGALLDRLATIEPVRGGGLAATLEIARRRSAGCDLVVVTGVARTPPASRLAVCQRHFTRTILIRAGLGLSDDADPAAGPAATSASAAAAPAAVTLPVPVINARRAEDVAASWRRGAAS